MLGTYATNKICTVFNNKLVESDPHKKCFENVALCTFFLWLVNLGLFSTTKSQSVFDFSIELFVHMYHFLTKIFVCVCFISASFSWPQNWKLNFLSSKHNLMYLCIHILDHIIKIPGVYIFYVF